MKKIYLLLITLSFCFYGFGQILTFEFSALSGNEANASSNSNDINLNSSTISRGAGLNASNNGGRFNATNWALSSISNAVSGDDYMEFTITPNLNFEFSVSSIEINLQRSATGPRGIAIRNSVDNYTTNLDSEKAINDVTSTQSFVFNFTQSSSSSPVTYRIYMFAEQTGGSGGIGDFSGNDLVVNGAVTAISSNDSDTDVAESLNTIDPETVDAATTIDESNAQDALAFVIEDFGTSDGLNTFITQMRFTPAIGNTADWSDHIQGITITDGLTPLDPGQSVSISDTEIIVTFSAPVEVDDADAIDVVLGFYLNTSNIVDGSVLQFQIDAVSSGFIANSTLGSDFISPLNGGDDIVSNEFTISAPSNDSDTDVTESLNTIDPETVDAATTIDESNAQDALAFVIEDFGTSDGLNTFITQMRFTPAIGNTADWSDHIQGITITDGLTPLDPGQSVSISDTEIIVTFSAPVEVDDADAIDVVLGFYLNTSNIVDGSVLQFQIDAVSSGFIANSTLGSDFISPLNGGDDIVSNEFTIDVPVVDSDTDVAESLNTIDSETVIATDVTSELDAQDALAFVIEDFGTSDGLNTFITQMRFTPAIGNTADWSDHIQGITITDGLTPLDPGQSVSISDTEIIVTFSAPVEVDDADAIDVVLGFYLNTSNIVDGSVLQFQIDAVSSGFIANSTLGSDFISPLNGGDDIVSNEFTIDVAKTKLLFLQQPSDTNTDSAMTPAVTVAGVDANNNIDTDNNSDVTVTSSGTLSGVLSETPISGISTFNSIIHTASGTALTLTASDTEATDAVSNPFNINLGPTCIAIEDFDNGTPTWPNDIASQLFVDPNSPDQGLFIQAATTNNSNFSGNTAFGRDLEGEDSEPSLSPYTFTFDPIDVSRYTSIEVAFDYHAFANADNGSYEVFIDGVGQGAVQYFNDPDTAPGVSGTITVPIVDGTSTVGLQLTGTLNGGSDVIEFDNFKLSGFVTDVYEGNADTGFGGALGNGDFEISANSGPTIDFVFNRGSGTFSDYIVVYIDSQSGGITTTANLVDVGDDWRKAVSGFDGTNRSTITFPPGFTPEYAISMSNADARFYRLDEGGAHSFVQNASLSPIGNASASSYTFNINFSSINATPGPESFKFLATYIDAATAFRSDESIGKNTAEFNPGQAAIEFITYYQVTSHDQGGKAPTSANGLWTNASSWENGNDPLEGDEIVIDHNINLNTDVNVNGLAISAGNTLTINSSNTLSISDGIIDSGNLNVDGTFEITNGGFTTIVPTYASGSTLAYKDISGTFNRFLEWNVGDIIGSGVPGNVIIDNSSVDLSATGGSANDGDFDIVNNLTLLNNGSLNIDPTKSLTVGNAISHNGGTITLSSTSTRFASLISSSVSGSGNFTYSRYTNETASAGGNDLVSPPVTGQTFSDFAGNNPNIVENPSDVSQKLFGPFNKTTGAYQIYDLDIPDDANSTLDPANAYRAASISGDNNFSYTGSMNTGTVNKPIVVSGPGFDKWNLIGNPYPSYIKLADFLAQNNTEFDTNSAGVYGYNGGSSSNRFEIWNLAFSALNPDALIAPGQGFFVASKTGGGSVNFTADMRDTGTSDDFIEFRNANISLLKLTAISGAQSYSTDFYFTNNASLGLDPGYDASVFGNNAPSFAIYSHLVQDDADIDMAIQSIANSDIPNAVIPLGINVTAGQQVTVSIAENTLPPSIEVYLEDNSNNTSTLLNNSDFIFTADNDLNRIGRFFLRFTDTTLSTVEQDSNSLTIFTTNSSNSVFVKGQLSSDTTVEIYDIQGRLVLSSTLDINVTSNEINVSNLSTGVYVVKLKNQTQQKTQKVILK
ncbi:T9SS type A sorting domain-containing protein [uncultured Psychroserpens sp.]|uniref:T9SS type A sorting domain-containing protein n=1 Tax=uncultured Psychroserpens sp. TaxID=255436 RepID=UPI00261DA7DB|nr:T9SS type A sorting domain-containing protein [uncultured Psychroserpens sp.]